jgi:hypothetical protein
MGSYYIGTRMNPTIKTVLALIFAILLFSWALSVMPQRDGFEPTIPEIDQINYMHLAENTRVPKKENMDMMLDSGSPSVTDEINLRLSMLDPPAEEERESTPMYGAAESMLSMGSIYK